MYHHQTFPSNVLRKSKYQYFASNCPTTKWCIHRASPSNFLGRWSQLFCFYWALTNECTIRPSVQTSWESKYQCFALIVRQPNDVYQWASPLIFLEETFPTILFLLCTNQWMYYHRTPLQTSWERQSQLNCSYCIQVNLCITIGPPFELLWENPSHFISIVH